MENFNDRYYIGRGGFATVYKELLSVGEILAVKKLYLTNDDKVADRRIFQSEIETLAGIRHRNIVKLYGYCCQSQLKFLVYAYMENGDLGQILHGEKAKNLKWHAQCEIVEGIAHALAYLHHDCSSPVVHRDISCNNVLLDSTFQACVSDFGTAKLLHSDISSWSKVAGSFGYMAPGIYNHLLTLLFIIKTRKYIVFTI
jgi:serine/threonine protein kinase